jgi:signal transduction histidine kinase
MLLGAAVSFLPLLVLLAAHYVFRMVFPWSLALLWFFVFPAAVGYGIVAKELFEIRMLARSSVAHGAATIAITGLYAFVITVAGAAVSSFGAGTRSPWFSVAFLFVAVLAFNPLRNRLQRIVDRVFDRDRATYREAVREISEAMVSMLSVKEVVDRILIALTDTMGVERALVLLFDSGQRHMLPEASRGDVDEDALALRIPADNPVVKQLWVRRDELARTDFDDEPDPDVREACRDVFDSLEVELLVPILFGVDLLGAIAVGRKLSGERLFADDRQLLRTLANQSAIAIENAKAFDEIAALNENLETRVEDRTRELQAIQAQLLQSEKMRSLGQLVAGVAHELNNPIGFVHANLQLLDEYVAKLVEAEAGGGDVERIREAIQKLLKRSREGTERVKKIVQDLRTFSRMDQAELQEVDLNAEIDRTLTLMEPRFRGGIVVERDYGVLPPLRCYAGPLGQVVLNLVMNACDALEGRGTITITTRSIPGDRVRFEVHDDGPGIPPELQGRIFEPFFTTKPVGQGTGLGLSLSHGIVERHGGRMLVSSEPGQGTTFVVELPLEAKEAA